MGRHAHACVYCRVRLRFSERLLEAMSEGGAAPPLRLRQRSAEWPDDNVLAMAWEAEAKVRESFRLNKSQLLAWPSPQLVGVASLRALALNVPVIQLALKAWGETCDFAKSMAVDWLKREAWF